MILAGAPAMAKPVSSKRGNGLAVIYEDYLLSQGGPVAQSVDRGAVAEAAVAARAAAVSDSQNRVRVLLYLTGDKPMADDLHLAGERCDHVGHGLVAREEEE